MSDSVKSIAPWSELPLRRVGRIVNGGTPRGDDKFWNGEIPFITPPDLRPVVGRTVTRTERTLTDEGVRTGSNVVPAGSVILSIRAPIGYVALTSSMAAFNQGCRAILPSPLHDARFITYALMASSEYLDSIGRGTTFMEISSSQLAEVCISTPPRSEQRAIADYLDRETQRIDELIAEQRGLIESLRERRVALISRAVRSGLDESVEMSPTGIDWLGEVPAHWEVRRLKYSMESVLPGVWGSDPQGDGTDVLCVRVADFDRPRLQVSEEIPTVRSVQMSDRVARSLEPEDLLIEKSGGTAINPVGFVAMYTGPSETAVYANFIARMRPAEGQVSRYWLYAHAASYATRLTARSVKQTTGIQNLDQTSYLDEKFPFPPADEQRKIASYLDDQTSRIDDLIAESEDLIALSLERRAALITAAVTGQIDVRTAA